MNTTQTPVQYIFSHEGLKAALYEALKEINISTEQKQAEPKAPASRHQACSFLSISLPTLDILLKSGQIKSFHIGRQVRINWCDLEAYVNKKGAEVL